MKSKTFTQMWNLIDRNYEEGDFGSRELLIGIFWEETMFQNRHQLHGSAVGFGQVEPINFAAINKWGSKNYNKTLIDISDDASVRVTIDYLNMLSSRLKGRRSVLDGYAGSIQRPKNAIKVNQWLDCERILQDNDFDTETVTLALKAAEQNHRMAIAAVNDV